MTSPSLLRDAVSSDAPITANTFRNNAGEAVFVNENYRISVSDTGEVRITNRQTGETYKVWGDPHVQVDGKQAFDFWGTTTFKLQDGTTVTIQTTPWKGGGKDGEATISSKVTISDGDYAAVISGVDDNHTGDLNFVEHHGTGVMVDARTDDGNVIYENPHGPGFVTQEGKKVDQAYIDATDLIKGGSFMPLGGLRSESSDSGEVWRNLLQMMLLWNLARDDSGGPSAARREWTDLIRELLAWQPTQGAR